MEELARQGEGPRKRPRQASHIPVWGDARWDPRANAEHDGRQDLVEARGTGFVNRFCLPGPNVGSTGSVSLEQKEAAAPAGTTETAKGKPSTFPEEKLKWVPRKRHNSRWPIQPKKEAISTSMVADLQPLIKFDVPASAEADDVALKMDEKQMRRRSTRRLSRRISLCPGEESPQKLPRASLLPAKNADPVLSPVRRTPVPRSPTKVADSPLRSFRVNASPTKVIFESPKDSDPVKSPSKQSISTSATQEDAASSSAIDTTGPEHLPSSPLPLLFDQPVPDVPAEPQHEARRRISLQSARRTDRGSSGVSRLLALKAEGANSSRRHSLASIESLEADTRENSKSRRRTLDVFCVEPDQRGISPDQGELNAAKCQGRNQVVEIDMKTNLDIFGQPRKAAGPASTQDGHTKETSSEEKQPAVEPESPSLFVTSVATPVKDSPSSEQATPAPSGEQSSVAVEAEPVVDAVDGHCQLATTPTAAEADADEQHFDSDSPPQESTSTSANTVSSESETEQTEQLELFTPYDPEGLSTIYEESSMVGGQADGSAGPSALDASASIPCEKYPNPASQGDISQATSGPETPSNGSPELGSGSPAAPAPAGQPTGEGQPAEEATPKACISVDVSINQAVAGADALLPDSPHHDPKSPVAEISQSPVKQEGDCEGTQTGDSSDTSMKPPADVSSEPVALGAQTMERPRTSDEPSEDTPAENGSRDDETLTAASEQEQRLSAPGEHADPASPVATLTAPLPGTPTPAIDGESTGPIPALEAPAGPQNDPQESSGFSPINSGQTDADGAENESADDNSDDLDADEVMELELPPDEDDEAAAATDEDSTAMVADGPRVENDTMQLRALDDDSETEMLRRFVSRVTADKNAKAAAAAAATLAKKSGDVKGLSGSTDSIASVTGSPTEGTDLETPAGRKPLGERSPNSPSPTKKRKLEEVSDDLAKGKDGPQDAAEHGDAPQPKRRRKRGDPVLENPVDSATPNPEPDAAPRLRRSARTRVALRPTAPSANSAALSMIPVRLPGMGAMGEAAVEAHLTPEALRRKAEKDLANVTRANTRKNKGRAVPPYLVLLRQAEDPSWRMRELKDVFDAKEKRAAEAGKGKDVDEGGDTQRKTKEVKWAEELVTQVEIEPSMLPEDVNMADKEADGAPADGTAASKPAKGRKKSPSSSTAASTKQPTSATSARATTTRRTRSSKLQPPTPVKVPASADKAAPAAAASTTPAAVAPASTSAPRTRARSLPKPGAAASTAAPPARTARATSPASEPSTRSTMATRRTRVAKLGMTANGTPAPKRRGRAAS